MHSGVYIDGAVYIDTYIKEFVTRASGCEALGFRLTPCKSETEIAALCLWNGDPF